MLSDAIKRGATALDALSAFDPKERKAYLNASEAFSCIRKQWYDKHADEADKDAAENWGYARRGKVGETFIVSCLRAANVPMLFTGDDQVQIRDEEKRISCTPDGLIMNDTEDGWLACEFKTIDPRTNLSNLPREQHVRQVQIAAAMFNDALHEFPELQGMPVTGCLLLYMDASNFDTIHEYPVRLKPTIMDSLEGRAKRVLDSTSASRLPREGAVGLKIECKQRCKWNKLCGVDGVGTSTGQGVSGSADGSVQVEAYLDAKVREEAAKADKAAAAELIKKILKNGGVSALEIDGHAVTLSSRAGSVSYAKVVQEHLPDVDLEPYRGASSETLTVK